MRKTFPAYTDEKALGNYYGEYIHSAIEEFQRRAKAEETIIQLLMVIQER